MSIKVYEYQNCSTCKKALQFLNKKKVPYQKLSITETPPSLAELRRMLSHIQQSGGSIKNLFNTSGIQYRELRIAEKLKNGMTEEEALKLLSQNGKLIKRPFVLTEKMGVVGFKEDVWKTLF